MQNNDRRQHEIEHGKFLAAGGAEALWGWGSPAGARRAERRAALVAKAAGLVPGVHALEIGCGTGMFTKVFAATGAAITANDISSELLDLATKLNPNVTFLLGPFEDLPASANYDAVIGSSVIHHLDLHKAIAKCLELLKPGGRIAFAEPNLLNPQVFAERTFLRKALKYVSPDETAFVRWRLADQLKQAGFTETKIVPFDWLHPSIPQPLISTVEAIGGLFEALPGIREFAGSLIISARKPLRS